MNTPQYAYTRLFGGVWWIFQWTPSGTAVRLHTGYTSKTHAEQAIRLLGYKLIPPQLIRPLSPMRATYPPILRERVTTLTLNRTLH